MLSVTVTQGMRPYMEDTYCVQKLQCGKTEATLLAVFDGHGGKPVAEMCKEKVAAIMKSYLITNPDVGICIRETFRDLDTVAKDLPENCGSTAVCVLLKGARIWFGNCGDSETMVAYKSGKTKMMSQSHKVENEKERIKELGAAITYDDGCARINRMLNVGRSIGDYHLKKYVISTPFISSLPYTDNFDYIIIASDGLWDVFDKESVHDLVTASKEKYNGQNMDKKQVTDKITYDLVHHALMKGSTDNISVVMLRF